MKKTILGFIGMIVFLTFGVSVLVSYALEVEPTDTGCSLDKAGGSVSWYANCLNGKLGQALTIIQNNQIRITSLENRVNALESRLTPVPTVDEGTIGCRYMENGKGMICSDGPKPVDGTDGVKMIQDFLKKEGSFTYPIATGYYGPITKEAVKQFQIKQGLTATGLIDKTTLQKMQTLAPTVAPSMSTYMQQVQTP